jgi:ketosteroid isomerase-like protein
MPSENVEFVRAIFSGSGAMDKEAILAALPVMIPQICDPEIEWVEDPQRADRRVYHGHDGVRESFGRWLEQWGEYDFEPERFVDCPPDKVLVIAREQARGAQSGASVTSRIYTVVTLRDGKILRYQEFYEEPPALEAAGLKELPDA